MQNNINKKFISIKWLKSKSKQFYKKAKELEYKVDYDSYLERTHYQDMAFDIDDLIDMWEEEKESFNKENKPIEKEEIIQDKDNLFDVRRGDSYIETILVKGHMINVFMNDPGQCYWLQWQDGDVLVSESCGTYNTDYKGYAEQCLFRD